MHTGTGTNTDADGPSDSKCKFTVNLFCFVIGCYGFVSVYILRLEKYDPDNYVLSHVLAWLLCSVLVNKFLNLFMKWIHHYCCIEAGDEHDERYRQRRAASWKFFGYALYFIAIGVLCSLSLKFYFDSPPTAVLEEGADVEVAPASRYLAGTYFLGILYACGLVKMILNYLIKYEPDLPDIAVDARNRLWINLTNWFLFSILSGILVTTSRNNLKILNKLPGDHYYNHRNIFSFSVAIFGISLFFGLILMAVNLAFRFFAQDAEFVTSVDAEPQQNNEGHAEETEPVQSLEQQVIAILQRMLPSVSQLFSPNVSQSGTLDIDMEMTEQSTTSRPDIDTSETSQTSPVQELLRITVTEKPAFLRQLDKEIAKMFQVPRLQQQNLENDEEMEDRPKLQRQDAVDKKHYPRPKVQTWMEAFRQ